MKLLYLGANSGTSLQRANALKRLGHEVSIIHPDKFVTTSRWASKFHYETGGLFADKLVTRSITNAIGAEKFDVVWVDGGRYVGPRLIQTLRQQHGPVLNYNVDDPYGTRDRLSWKLYQVSVKFYDAVAVVREENVPEANALGARKVLRVYRSADEVAHSPRKLTPEDLHKWDSEVEFIGTWMPERGPFMAELLKRGVPLSIRGDFWQKAPEWPQLQGAWRGPGITNDDDYAKSIQCAKICLGLLSKGNRDLHTTRSLEIPNLGGLFCAERTVEHLFLYKEDEEAVFWDNAAECADKCLNLLANEEKRRDIAKRGQYRCLQNKTLNEPTMEHILGAVIT